MSQAISKNTTDAIKAFISHVESLENSENPDDNNGFKAEYKLIQEAQAKNRIENVFPMDVGKTLNNVKKNRYKDILPYDEHRVVLSVVDDDQDSDYINASKLMGVRGTGGYIATQGPLAITVNDFWRMIWEYNVEIIFMACKIVETGKIKCKQYWNDEGKSEEFGDITVMTEAEKNIMSDCKRRSFQVTRGEEVRHVVQFHYTGWPDHDIPDDAGHIRDMIGIMRQTRQNQQAPLLVHCSAGCGRSGAIITIDYVWTLLEEGKFDDTFNLFDLICNFREQRMSIVQTADQYALVNKVLKTLCEEWLTRMASHTYENVEVDQTCDVNYQNTDASKSVSGEQIYEDKLTSGNRVHNAVPGLNREMNPTAEQKHIEESEEASVSPSKIKAAQLTAYENVLQNKGTNQNQTEKGSHKTVIKVESRSKFGSPGSKKAQAPSPPSSPLGSDTKGGFKQHLAQVYQNAVPSPPSVSTSAMASKQHQPTANGTPDEPIYTVVNKSPKHQTPGPSNYSAVNKETPTSPTVFNFAKVLPASEDFKGAGNKKVFKAPIPQPHPMKQAAISTDQFGYSSIDSCLPDNSPTSVPALYSHLHQTNPPLTAKPTPVPADNFAYSSIDSCLPNKSPASVPAVYSHLHQAGPSPAVGGTDYCSIGDMNSGSTAYEDVRLPTTANKPTVPVVVVHGRRQSNNSCLNLAQVNSHGVPGFNGRLPRVRGPVPMPQSWTRN